MKKKALLLGLTLSLLVSWFPFAWAQCPEDTLDSGVCDTVNVKVLPVDTAFFNPGQLVRVPIYVTHDVPDPTRDSIACFVIPLCYEHSNPSKYCSLSIYWNTKALTGDQLARSIFRDMVGIDNWMLDQFEKGNGEEWNAVFLDLDGTSVFWLDLISTGMEDQEFGPENHRLLVTMTFIVQDTITVCIDSCFWPPNERLWFVTEPLVYVPRHNLPYCFSISCPVRGNTTGGINGDCRIDIGDIIFLISYLYKDGHPLDPLERGDADCNGVVDIGDVIYLINYLFKGGPAPSC